MLYLWPLLDVVSTAASLLGGEHVVSWPDSRQMITFLLAYCFYFCFYSTTVYLTLYNNWFKQMSKTLGWRTYNLSATARTKCSQNKTYMKCDAVFAACVMQ